MGTLQKVLFLFLLSCSGLTYHLPNLSEGDYLPLSSYPFPYRLPSIFLEPSAGQDGQREMEFIEAGLRWKKFQLLQQALNNLETEYNGTSNTSAFFRLDPWYFFSKTPNTLARLLLNNRKQTPATNNKDFSRLLYIGAGNVNAGNSANYLFKTSYAFVSATATLCEVSTCIPANQFSSGYSAVTCKRKRSVQRSGDIEPSTIDPMLATAMPESKKVFIHYSHKTFPPSSEAVLQPSFTITEEIDENTPSRKKRFLFVVTSTVTTYAFVTSTLTYRLSLLTTVNGFTGYLTCRPANVGIC